MNEALFNKKSENQPKIQKRVDDKQVEQLTDIIFGDLLENLIQDRQI